MAINGHVTRNICHHLVQTKVRPLQFSVIDYLKATNALNQAAFCAATLSSRTPLYTTAIVRNLIYCTRRLVLSAVRMQLYSASSSHVQAF